MNHGRNISLLITCMDYRLHQRANGRNVVAEFTRRFIAADCDLSARAGGILPLALPEKIGPNSDAAVLRDLDVSVNLHGAKNIFILAHEDCGAYKAIAKFANSDDEFECLRRDLLRAREIIIQKFPGVVIRLFIAKLKKGSVDDFSSIAELV